MIHIQISEKLGLREQKAELHKLLEGAARQVLSYTGADPSADLSIVLGDDLLSRQLNARFIGNDAPTDVLAFPGGDVDPDSGAVYLGDVIISYPRATAQAEAGNHSVGEELQLLVVHGVLHLMGYDHTDEAEKAHMWSAQTHILRSIGCSINP